MLRLILVLCMVTLMVVGGCAASGKVGKPADGNVSELQAAELGPATYDLSRPPPRWVEYTWWENHPIATTVGITVGVTAVCLGVAALYVLALAASAKSP